MANIGPGAYDLPETFNNNKQRMNLSMKNFTRLNRASVTSNKITDRFQYANKQLEKTRNYPGPGCYFDRSDTNAEKHEKSAGSLDIAG
jgi:hypothetical protein